MSGDPPAEGAFEAKSFIEIEAALGKAIPRLHHPSRAQKDSHNHRRGPNDW